MLSVLTRVLYLALCIFLHRGIYLPAVMLLLRPGSGMRMVLLAHCVCWITPEAVNLIQNIHSVLFACPRLGCYVWVLLNNHTQPLGGTAESGFFQPSSTAAVENTEFPLDVKDGITLLSAVLCLLCAVYAVLGSRAVLGMAQQLLQEQRASRNQPGREREPTASNRNRGYTD